VLIEQFKDEFDEDYEIFDNTSDSITKLELNMLYIMTAKDTSFMKRVSKEKGLRDVIVQLTNDQTEHPKIKAELIHIQSLEITTITDEKFRSFFGKSSRIEKVWERIVKKYETDKVFKFSQVNYTGQFAATYYEIHCGSLCGSGNMVVFEKVNRKWNILTEICFWGWHKILSPTRVSHMSGKGFEKFLYF
jgi:hypothetical protein